jgi:hypothetical protein
MKKNKLLIIIYETFFAVLALVVVSFAWFTYSDEISTTGINLEVKGAINISISNDQKNWNTVTNISPSGVMKLTELSGDGINLFSPVIADKNVIGYTHVGEFSESNLSYLEFKFYINSNGPAQLTYGVGCSVVPSNNSKLQDNIAGAIRVACFDTTGGKTPTSSVVWAPNSTYQYSSGSVNKAGTVETKYTYATGSSTTLKEVLTNGNTSGVSEDKNFVWGDITEQMVADMNPFLIINTEHGEKSVSEVTVRIWIEGTDREAVKDLIGGQFKVHLSFKAGDVYES